MRPNIWALVAQSAMAYGDVRLTPESDRLQRCREVTRWATFCRTHLQQNGDTCRHVWRHNETDTKRRVGAAEKGQDRASDFAAETSRGPRQRCAREAAKGVKPSATAA
jgi:hypothetical protein